MKHGPAGIVIGLCLAARPALAQVPPLLTGKWEVRQISFSAERAVPDSIVHKMDNPQVATLNNELWNGGTHLVVEFRPDGTYQFVQTSAGHVERIETGTYSVRGNTLFGQSPGTESGSSFDDQHLTKLTGRVLLLTFPAGPELPNVVEEIEYRRLKH